MLQTRGPGPKWLRVYVVNYGNSGSAYVTRGGVDYYLSPGAELIVETIRDGGTLDTALAAMAAWPDWMKDAEKLEVPRRKCFHVTTAGGELYGVAAITAGDAMDYLQARLTGEGSKDTPARAEYVDTWTAELGAVLHYGPAPATAYRVGQTVKLHNTHPGDGGWSSAYVESTHGSTYAVRVQGHSLYWVTAAKLSPLAEDTTEGGATS
jgi:hypothetical protein